MRFSITKHDFSSQNPWLEYVDYWSVQRSQLQSLKEWHRCCHQEAGDVTVKMPSQTPTTPLEPADPLQRIYRRLNSYEQPIPPPALTRYTPLVAHVPKECLYNPDAVVELVKPHLKVSFSVFNMKECSAERVD